MTYRLATCYLKTGNVKEAAIWFETLRSTSKKYAADCTYYISYIRYTQQRYDEAMTGFLSLQDNAKYKAKFHCKACMIKPDELVVKVGHPMGGVCPFAVCPGVPVYLDESLRRFDIVYPAAGTAASAVRLAVPELEHATENFSGWVDIAKGWQE